MVPPILRPPDLEADIRSSDPKAFSLQVFKQQELESFTIDL
jgi:hypothetical protein